MEPASKALIVVDVQKDFCPGGALAVTDGDKVIPVINAIKPLFDVVLFTADWHPADHCSFTKNGGPWPAHCVQNTEGAELHPDLDITVASDDVLVVIHKGQKVDVDSYSGFSDNEQRFQTALAQELRCEGVGEVYICGLAMDYCIKATALDAVAEGFKTFVVFDACRAVNVEDGAVLQTVTELFLAGVTLMESYELMALSGPSSEEHERKNKTRKGNRSQRHKNEQR